MLIKDNTTVLFQGDSITDCGRNRETNDLGSGYPNFVASMFAALYPDMNVKFINRGVSGDRVRDLQNRWNEDCIALKPDYISILVGVNDTWRKYDANDPTSAEAFKKTYHDILTQIKEKTKAEIIIMEPYVLNSLPDRKQWREDLDPKIQVVRELAREFKAHYIPLDGIFAQACCGKEPSFWSEDGVHPNQTGHALIAKNWLMTVGALK